MTQLENNAAYIQIWLERLKNDKKFIVYASSQAQKATDYILNIKNEEKELNITETNHTGTPKSIERINELRDTRLKENSFEMNR